MYNKFKGVGVHDTADYEYNLEGAHKLNWKKPTFPQNKLFTSRFIANWTKKQCKLTIFYNDEKLNSNQNDYTMLLPTIDARQLKRLTFG